MAEKILMLALSPTMDTGVIAKWLKKVGDEVAEGDLLCEVETDKAVMEYESPAAGTLLAVIIEEGDKAAVGDLIAVVGKEGEDVASLVDSAAKSSAPAGKQIVDKAEPGEPSSPSVVAEEVPDTTSPTRSSPLARKLAEKHGLDLQNIQGSGPAGRIVKRDIEGALSAGTTQSTPATTTTGDTEIPVTGKRRMIAKRLSESMFTAPHYYLKKTVRMDALLEARNRLKEKGEKLSLNAFLLRFVAEALHRHPQINATWQGDTILRHGSVDIGLAVAQPDGLITPIVRNCAEKGILQIDTELAALIGKAQDNKLQTADYTGATFTISNLGSYGIEEFTAIINPPGSAILAVGRISRQQVVGEADRLEIISAMKLTLSCDHRVIDGAVGAAFLKDLTDMMEDPIRTLL